MSKYSTFFPTGGTGGGSTPTNRLNRRIFTGELTSCSWPVPSGTTSIEVHVWGGGGGGCSTGQVVDTLRSSGGGGGGGYARTTLNVTDSDTLSITVGGNGGTSSVTVPTQSPGSPISATGGSNGSSSPVPCACGGSGGSGSVSLAPTQPTTYCFTAPGGRGGCGVVNLPLSCVAYLGSGGAAGSPRGQGGDGGSLCCCCANVYAWSASGGGGIGGPGQLHGGGSKYGAPFCVKSGGGGDDNQFNSADGLSSGHFTGQFAECSQDTWWKVEDIKGAGGLSADQKISFSSSMVGGTGAGGGGGAYGYCQFYQAFAGCQKLAQFLVQGARGGFLGGAGAQINVCVTCTPVDPTTGQPNPPDPSLNCCFLSRDGIDGKGGCAGGSSGSPGTPGVVIIYW
jgi:hypothetical protein